MGTWDVGPFDNDAAADFSVQLDEAAAGQRAELLRAAMEQALAAGYLEVEEAQEAVAAAALVAAQRPGGEPVDPAYGPKAPIPLVGTELAELAVRVLERVGLPECELAELWADSGEEERWRERLARLRAVLMGGGC
ncbi:DUF4259 domain-containing protein [Kitasatospora kifunensis]|uniref:DUF4259 domain-containing protein n=1 Tax=Kitasatospora kifunensis TaxID=58351 RepID=A0A7W7QXL0_KITKI|nr:DUF4259 domain-containing protein [Kitasatospora kifunensis]MBB4921648.1 hypothetical protein [Kitasatospora kifunensis]